jgi:hypothetical protein
MAVFSFFLFPLCFSQFLFTVTMQCLTSNLLPSPPLLLNGCAVHLLPFFTALTVLLFPLSLYFVLSSVVKEFFLDFSFFFPFIPLLVLTFWSFSTVLFPHCTFSYYPLCSPSLCLRLGCFAREGASKWTWHEGHLCKLVHSSNEDTNGLKIIYISRASLRSCLNLNLNLNLSVAFEDLNPIHVWIFLLQLSIAAWLMHMAKF